ncbi:iron chaperone [Cellulomonas sp. 179-A 4D5 NHS]|uniref:iron chaperone n=1 Tax=Cellulomonas sp. 179-A 4D5 NHS TaxID=3142378 RepID=UPI0039A37B66
MSTSQRNADTAPADGDATFSAEERAAMKERARELKAQSRKGKAKVDPEAEVLAKIAEMTGLDRTLAERVHALVREVAPDLTPRTWYGMPGYAKDGKVLCFFTAAEKFKGRYATLGFNDVARLDDGSMWPTAFALTGLSDDVEGRIRELVARAAA